MEEVQLEVDFSNKLYSSVLFLEDTADNHLREILGLQKKKEKKKKYNEEEYNICIYQVLPYPPDCNMERSLRRFEGYLKRSQDNNIL